MKINLWLLSLDMLFIYFPTLYGSNLIKGINPVYAAWYNPSELFTCLDKSATISFNLVNDDYCDCIDGSDEPGTAACPNSQFYCANSGHVEEYVPSSFVNDMRCDCCDGSDEYLNYSHCPNTCGDLAREKEAKLAVKRKEILSGHETYKIYVAKKAIELEEQERRDQEAERIRAEEEELERERVEAEAQERAERGEPEPQETEDELASLEEPPIPGMEGDEESMEQKAMEPQLAEQESEDGEPPKPQEDDKTEEEEEEEGEVGRPKAEPSSEENLDETPPYVEPEAPIDIPTTPSPPPKPIDYGPDNGFMMLTEPGLDCLEFAQKEYIYSLCPFKDAFQRQTHEAGRGVNLGSWQGWKNHPDDSAVWPKSMKMDLPYDSMLYENGAGCWNGPPRSVTVRVVCGSENRLTSVEEPNRCTYEFRLQTPAACHHHPEKLMAMYHTEL